MLLARNTGFSVISKFLKKVNTCSFGLEEQAGTMIKLFTDRGILGNHFQAVTQTPLVSCIDCDNILWRCIFVPSVEDEVYGYTSPVLRQYQHD